MNVTGSGFITIIIYGNLGESVVENFALITEAGSNLTTESGSDLLTENAVV